MNAKLRMGGLVVLFLAGVISLYLGFSGIVRFSGKGQEKPLNNVIQVNSPESTPSAFFVTFRQNRENDRQKQLDLLSALINNSNATQEARTAAQTQLLGLAKEIAKEGEIENLVLAKGFQDVVAKISNNNLNLLVYGEQLSKEDVVKLQDIAVRTSGISLEHIVVTPRK